jgi:hypothetical protein
MLSIKFRSKKRVTLKDKIGIVNTIFDIIGIQERKEFFYSDYTFSKVEESTSIGWIDDLLESNTIDEIDDKLFITLTAESTYGTVLVEIIPRVARKNVTNCPHIDINLESDILLYDIFKNSQRMEYLKKYFDRMQDVLSEYYFFDLKVSPNCYSDIRNRLFSKFYDEFDFSKLLLKDHAYNDRLNEKNIKTIGDNFTSRILQKDSQTFMQNLITDNNLNVACATGSLELYGEDVPVFIDLIMERLNEYINRIIQKDIYSTEFDTVFKSGRRSIRD